jgi:nucleoside-diphosphate-sugar epimerase
MKVLVTGATGYLGAADAEALAAYKVRLREINSEGRAH